MVDELSKYHALKIHDKNKDQLFEVNQTLEPNKKFEWIAMRLQNHEAIMQNMWEEIKTLKGLGISAQ